MGFLAPTLAGAAGSAVSGLMGGSGGNSSSSNALLQQEQGQFEANFALQTHQAMIDNTNATNTAVANSHAQTAAAATASAREVGQANAHILA